MNPGETASDTAVTLAVVGASAGGVEALKALAAALPPDLQCPVVVVLHLSARGTSVLSSILARSGPLPATPIGAQTALPGRGLLVAPPDRHVMVTTGGLVLSGEPREHGVRPAVDPTMRSAAAVHAAGTVGIVLSGTGEDGAQGLVAIREAGGRVLVQDPEEAHYSGMPEHALAALGGGEVHTVAAIAEQLAAWAVRPPGAPADPAPSMGVSEAGHESTDAGHRR